MAAQIKIIDLAKELRCTSKELIEAAHQLGYPGLRVMTPIDPRLADALREKFRLVGDKRVDPRRPMFEPGKNVVVRGGEARGSRRVFRVVRGLWHDPVWSKVIGSVIFGIAASLASALLRSTEWSFFGLRSEHSTAANERDPLSEQDRGYRNMVIGTCEQPTRNIKELLEIARAMPTQEKRETEISVLVPDAICSGDEPLAMELFLKLQSVDMEGRCGAQSHGNLFERRKAWTGATVGLTPQ